MDLYNEIVKERTRIALILATEVAELLSHDDQYIWRSSEWPVVLTWDHDGIGIVCPFCDRWLFCVGLDSDGGRNPAVIARLIRDYAMNVEPWDMGLGSPICGCGKCVSWKIAHCDLTMPAYPYADDPLACE